MQRLKNNAAKLLGCVMLAFYCVAATPASGETQAPFAPGFYPFANGMRFGSAEEGVRLIKGLGYSGVGSVYPKDLAKLKAACDKEGLKVFSAYIDGRVNAEDFSYDKDASEAIRLLKATGALIELNVQRGKNPNDAQATALVKAVADMAKEAGLKVVIYPHANFHIERIDHALKIAKATGCDNVGVAFNLCHFLKVQPADDFAAVLAEAKPLLWSVSICGADVDGKDWNSLIRPLDEGTFDNATLLKRLREVRFEGAIGLQCFNIRIDPTQNLTRSMQAWMKHRAASTEKAGSP